MIGTVGRGENEWAGTGKAGVVTPAAIGRSRNAGRLTGPTAHQCAQQILMSFIVARCLFLVQCEFCLHAFKLLIGDQSRHCSSDAPPVCRCGILSASGLPQWVRSRSSSPCGPGPGATNIQSPGVTPDWSECHATMRHSIVGSPAATAVPLPADASPNYPGSRCAGGIGRTTP